MRAVRRTSLDLIAILSRLHANKQQQHFTYTFNYWYILFVVILSKATGQLSPELFINTNYQLSQNINNLV